LNPATIKDPQWNCFVLSDRWFGQMLFELSEKNAEMRTKRPEKQIGGNVILPASAPMPVS
jgi:hypothetical protein